MPPTCTNPVGLGPNRVTNAPDGTSRAGYRCSHSAVSGRSAGKRESTVARSSMPPRLVVAGGRAPVRPGAAGDPSRRDGLGLRHRRGDLRVGAGVEPVGDVVVVVAGALRRRFVVDRRGLEAEDAVLAGGAEHAGEALERLA